MSLIPDVALQVKLQRWSRYLTVLVILIAGLVLFGWQFEIGFLKRPVPELVAMNPVTAFAFICSGISFFLITSKSYTKTKQIVASVFAVLVLLIALLKITSLLFGIDFHVDRILFYGKLDTDAIGNIGNRMAVNTAFCFLLSGIALSLMTKKFRKQTPSHVLAIIIFLLAFLAIVGYLYRVQEFYGLLIYIPMALNTALCFSFLSLAILFAQPGEGIMKEITSTSTGSITARLLIAVAILLPVVLGFLRLYGDWIGLFTTEFGSAILVLAIIIIFLAVIWYNAVLLNRRDALRMETENALLESENQMQTIFNAAPDAVIVIDRTGRIIKWNAEAEKLFEWTTKDVTGKLLKDTIIPVRYRESHDRGMQKFLATGKGDILGKTIEIQAIKKDNTEFDVSLKISPVLLKGEYLFVGFVRDITEQKIIEQKRRMAEEKFQALFDSSADATVIVNEQGIIQFVNRQAIILFGYSGEELTGNPVEVLIPSESKGSHIGHRQAFHSQPRARYMGSGLELFALKNDGTKFPVEISLSPLQTEEGMLVSASIRDITERKLIEEKLKSFNKELARQVEEKTKEITEIFERLTDGFIALDNNFCCTYLNKKAGELIRRDPASMIGKNVWAELPDVVGSATYEAFNKAMKEQHYVINTDYYDPLDLWQENHIYPSPNGLWVFIRDITERKKAEQKINEARNLADKLIDSLPGVFYFFDSAGKFIRWNRHFEEVTGYSSDEVAGMHPTEFFGEDEKQYISERIEGVFLKGINDAEASFLTKTGKKIPYYFRAVLINYEGEPCLLGNGIDITERKKAEEELRTSEQKYKLLFESNPLPMWMLSLPDYDIIEANDSALLLYGYTKDEFLQLDILDLRPAEDIEKFKASMNRQFRGIYHGGIWRHRKKNGSIIYVDIVTHDLYYEGKPVRLVLANDVTEKYIAQEKLKESYDSIRKLTDYLQKVREEERTHIAREIHDELGQQLTILKMDIAWLNKKIDTGDEPVKEKMNELLAMIDTTVKTVRRIASELRPSLLDDLGLVAAMEWHLEEFEKRSGIHKHFTAPETNMQLHDEMKIGLFRIFQESLTNVARHSKAKNVNVKLKQDEKEVILTIADDGEGYNEKNAGKGTLGILGMKERTLMLGGHYKISGTPGKGTTVSVVVPINGRDQ